MKTSYSLQNVKKSRLLVAFAFALSAMVSSFVFTVPDAQAAMSNVTVRNNLMTASTATSGTVCAQTSATQTEAFVDVTFPTGFATVDTFGNWTVSVGGTAGVDWPTGANNWPGILTATVAAGQTVRFPSGDLTAATLYCFNFTGTSTLTNATAGTYTDGLIELYDSGPSLLESAQFSMAAVTDPTLDVDAEVPPSFALALEHNADDLGVQSAGSVDTSTDPMDIDIDTNATSGWIVWASDSNAGLDSASASHTISTTPGTNTNLVAGTEGFVSGITAQSVGTGTGTITIDSDFDATGANEGAGLDGTQRILATCNGPTGNGIIELTNALAISAVTPAATDYTDTITITGAGVF